jgi:membrane protease YdiL (CAAX protease family)
MAEAQPTAHQRDHWLPADLWIIVGIFAALIFIRPGDSLLSSYALRWYAVAFVLIAVGGRRYRWLGAVSAVVGGAAAVFELFNTARSVVVHADWSVWPYLIGGVLVASVSALQLAELTRRHAIDPVHAAGIQLAIGLSTRWLYELTTGQGLMASSYAPTTTASPFRTELPYLALAFAAAGLGISRAPRAAVRRLGLVWPAWWQPILAVFVAAMLVGSVGLFSLLTFRLMPATYWAIAAVEDKSNNGMGLGVALLFAIFAGIGEETLFRGALQPRIGIVAAALLFTVIHIQYGFSPILAGVFLHGLVYGVLRRSLNTTTAVMTHASYDALAYIGLSLVQLNTLLVVTGLIVTILYFRSRQQVDTALGQISIRDWIGFTPSSSVAQLVTARTRHDQR